MYKLKLAILYEAETDKWRCSLCTKEYPSQHGVNYCVQCGAMIAKKRPKPTEIAPLSEVAFILRDILTKIEEGEDPHKSYYNLTMRAETVEDGDKDGFRRYKRTGRVFVDMNMSLMIDDVENESN